MSQGRTSVLIALALAVVGALAWVLLKPAPSAAASLTNRSLFVVMVATAALLAFRFRSASGTWPIVLVSTSAGLFFLAVSVLFVVHLGAVLSLPLRSASASYDFRFYSLLLLGVVGFVPGALGLGTWRGLTRGIEASWRRATRACFVLLMVNVPLIPLQDFAVAFSICGASVLAGLSLARTLIRAQELNGRGHS